MLSGWVGDQDPTFEGLENALKRYLQSAWAGKGAQITATQNTAALPVPSSSTSTQCTPVQFTAHTYILCSTHSEVKHTIAANAHRKMLLLCLYTLSVESGRLLLTAVGSSLHCTLPSVHGRCIGWTTTAYGYDHTPFLLICCFIIISDT